MNLLAKIPESVSSLWGLTGSRLDLWCTLQRFWWAQSSAQVGLQEWAPFWWQNKRGPWEIKLQYTHYNSLGKCITSLWCFNFPHILSQFTSELGKHWICSQIEFINCSVCSYFKPGLANSYANQARWGWGAGVVVVSSAIPKCAAGNPTDLLSVASRTPAQEQLVKKWKLPDWKGKGKLSLFAMPYYI